MTTIQCKGWLKYHFYVLVNEASLAIPKSALRGEEKKAL